MAYVVVASASAGSTDGGQNVFTPTIDTTGASLLVLAVSSYQPAGPQPVVFDSHDNTYIGLTLQEVITDVRLRLYYVVNPVVGAGHFVAASSSNGYPSIAVIALSGAHASPFDQQNGATDQNVFTLQTGSVTPSEGNEILITVIGVSAGATSHIIDSGFTEVQSVTYLDAQHFGIRLAYLIQTTGEAVNPAWSWNNVDNAAAAIATFKAATGGGGAPPVTTARILVRPVGFS